MTKRKPRTSPELDKAFDILLKSPRENKKPIIPPHIQELQHLVTNKPKKRDPLAGLKKHFEMVPSEEFPGLLELLCRDMHVCYVRTDTNGWTVARAIAKLGAKDIG